MDYKKIAEEALAERMKLVGELRSVQEDTKLSDAEKQERTGRLMPEIQAKEDEARSAVRDGERAAEVSDLEARAGNLIAPSQGGEQRNTNERDLAAEFRSLATGDLKEVVVDLGDALRVATVGTAANAGNTSPTSTFVAQVIEAMRERSDFFNRATIFNTTSGETLDFPRKTGRPTAAQVAENAAYGTSDETWARSNLHAFKYGVIVQATEEVVSDSALDILSILATDAGEAVADAALTDLMVGAGTTLPFGYVTRATGTVNAANLAGVSIDNLIDLKHSLTAPYRRNAVLMASDSLIAAIAKKKDTTNQYLWQPSVVAGEPDRIIGVPILTDPNIVTSGSSAKVAVYGDPKKYMIRQVRALRVVRSDEFGYNKDLVSFKVTWRGDGDLLDTSAAKALTVTA